MIDHLSIPAILYAPSPRKLSLAFDGTDEKVAGWLQDYLNSSREVSGRLAGRGVKIVRHSRRASQRGAFAPVFYGVIQEVGGKCRLVGHFQFHPVGRLYIVAWIVLGTVLALVLLVGGLLGGSPESTARDALPFTLPVILPFLGLGFAHWQLWRGRSDEAAIRNWLESLAESRQKSN